MGDNAARPPLGSGTIVAIVLMAVLAAAAFIVLLDVRLNYDDPILSGVTDFASRSTMTALSLSVEAVCFLAMALLVFLRPRQAPATSWGEALATATLADDLQIGCPGCGTVFEKPLTSVDEPHEQSFRCPNCGRAGRLRMELRKPVHIRAATCGNCGSEFQTYREGAECPHCHAPAAVS